MAPWSLAFRLPGLPTIGPNARRHWAKVRRENQDWYWAVRAAVGKDGPPQPLQRARVTLLRQSTAERIDSDNLAASWKPVLDGLVRAKVLADDSSRNVELVSKWEHVDRRADQGIGVSVVALDSPSGHSAEGGASQHSPK